MFSLEKRKEILKQWIADLRSGKFKQGRNSLKLLTATNYEYCCLGVLCERLKVPQVFTNFSPARYKFVDQGAGSMRGAACGSLLPKSVVEDMGFVSEVGESHPGGRFEKSLAALNDFGVSFNEIADRLEKYPHVYLKEFPNPNV